MEEQENLVDYVNRRIDETMRELGFAPQTTPSQKKKTQETTPVSGTITFLKGDSAKRAKEFFQQKKQSASLGKSAN